jgi:hypothetical protein
MLPVMVISGWILFTRVYSFQAKKLETFYSISGGLHGQKIFPQSRCSNNGGDII